MAGRVERKNICEVVFRSRRHRARHVRISKRINHRSYRGVDPRRSAAPPTFAVYIVYPPHPMASIPASPMSLAFSVIESACSSKI